MNQYYVATLAKWVLIEAVDEKSAREKGEEYFQGTKSAYSKCKNCGHHISSRIIRELADPTYCTQCGGEDFEPVPMVKTVRLATSDDHALNDLEIVR